MSFFTNKKPRVGLYILVWFLAFVPSNIAVSLLDTFLSGAIIKSVDDLNNYAFIAFPLLTIVAVAIIVFVYKKFPNLKMSKVMPWIYVLSAASFSRTFMETKEVFEPLNVDLTIFNIGLILTFIAQVLGVRYFFIKSKQW
tara:strand:- start:51 stop:470 length:420 start_codon:yes stop_codon:yes gene_type:complete